MSDPAPATRIRGYLPPEDRSEFGNWLLGAMGDMSFEQLAAAMEERGHRHTPSYYIAMSGRSKKPGRVIRDALYDYFKSTPAPAETPAATGDQAALVRAINDLVTELRLSRVRQETFDQQILELVAAATGTRPAREEQPSDTERGVPVGSGR